jgi:hypothetical protein
MIPWIGECDPSFDIRALPRIGDAQDKVVLFLGNEVCENLAIFREAFDIAYPSVWIEVE